MYSLSMPAALANTPAPAYLDPAISSRPWIVPSSPYAPCSSGSTTSTSPRLRGGSPGAVTTRPREHVAGAQARYRVLRAPPAEYDRHPDLAFGVQCGSPLGGDRRRGQTP